MVFQIEDEQNKVMATVQHNGQVETYECFISACDEPVCTCGTMYFDLVPVQEDEDSKGSLRQHWVEIDIYEKKLAYKNEKEIPKEELAFANEFLAQLDEKDYGILHPTFYVYKNKLTEEGPADAIDAYFNYEEVEYNGAMYTYNDVLPYGNQLYMTFNDASLVIFDQYCIQPTCTCTDVFLNLFNVEKNGSRGSEYGIISLDYKKKIWALMEDGPSFDLNAVRSEMQKQIPDIYSLLRKRHKRLKAIYAYNKEKNFASEADFQTKKVGRNDPCPCGSGKKYKKCCMGKD